MSCADVAYARNRQGYVFKALTDKAKRAMGEFLGGPWQIAAGVYWSEVSDDRLEGAISRLRSMNLRVEERSGSVGEVVRGPKRVDVSKYLA